MTAILEGKSLAKKIISELKTEVANLKAKGILPGLAVVLVGRDPASKVYVRNKKRACQELGINSEIHILKENAKESEILELIKKLNQKGSVHGILVQLPLPKHLNEEKIVQAVSPQKDVDCFHAENIGRILTGSYGIFPCTPAGILEILKRNGIEIEGKDCVVIGRSNIVGKPVALMLLNQGGTVTVCHSKTKDLKTKTREADILVVAAGKARLVTADMVKEGAVVIDVGINRTSDGKLVGDVDYEGVQKKASAITPVPGGVGPMTIAVLMRNTVKAARIINLRK